MFFFFLSSLKVQKQLCNFLSPSRDLCWLSRASITSPQFSIVPCETHTYNIYIHWPTIAREYLCFFYLKVQRFISLLNTLHASLLSLCFTSTHPNIELNHLRDNLPSTSTISSKIKPRISRIYFFPDLPR